MADKKTGKEKTGGKASKGTKASKAKSKPEDKKPEQEIVKEPVKTLAEIKQSFTVTDLQDKDYKVRPYNLFYNFNETELNLFDCFIGKFIRFSAHENRQVKH